MNIGRVYASQIYINNRYDFIAPGLYRMYGDYVKDAFVYHRNDGKYVDLLSDEVYGSSEQGTLGEMFVNINTLIPLCEIINKKINYKNISKKKVLKLLYDEAIRREGEVEKE